MSALRVALCAHERAERPQRHEEPRPCIGVPPIGQPCTVFAPDPRERAE